MKVQHKIFISTALLASLLVGGASFAFAQTASTTDSGTATSTTATTTPPAPTPVPTTPPVMQKGEWKLEIGPAGHVLLRGNVESVSGNILKIKSWGGTWTVRVNTGMGVEVFAHDMKPTDLAQFSVGDYAGASGIVSKTEALTIDGKVVRNWTEKKRAKEERKDNEKTWKRLIKDTRGDDLLADRIIEGVFGTTSGSSFTVTYEGVTLTIATNATTKFLDRNWKTITFGDMASGDKVRVFGDVTASSSLVAEVVRDTSLPRELPKSFQKENKGKSEDKKENEKRDN